MFNAFQAFSEAANVTEEERLDKIRHSLNYMIYRLVKDIRENIEEAMVCGTFDTTVYYVCGGFLKFGGKTHTLIKQLLIPFISERIIEKLELLGYNCFYSYESIEIKWGTSDGEPPKRPELEYISNEDFVNSVTEHFKAIKNS